MNFVNTTEIREYLNSLKRSHGYTVNPNCFYRVKLNSFYIELIAGRLISCEPSLFLDNILFYKKIQLFIYENINGFDHAICPKSDIRFMNFEWSKYFTYIKNNGKVMPSYKGDMVPIEEVICLIKDVYKISKLKVFY